MIVDYNSYWKTNPWTSSVYLKCRSNGYEDFSNAFILKACFVPTVSVPD